MRSILLVILALTLSGCGTIKDYQKVEEPLGKVLSAGPGDVVLRVNRSKSLPNVFGAADVFGRRTNVGYVQVRFLGIEADGTVVLSRRDIEVQSNETTMSASRNPFVLGSTHGTAQTSVVTSGSMATAQTTASAQQVAVQPTDDYHIVIPPDDIAIRVPAGTKTVQIAGHSIELIAVSGMALSYRLRAIESATGPDP